MIFVRMPEDRVAVLIGQKGTVKRQIEKMGEVKIKINSKSADVSISFKGEGENFKAMAARDVIKAIALGFSSDTAMRLFDDDNYLAVLDIRDFAGKTSKHVRRVRARIIGVNGKTRRVIEELSGADMVIYENTVGIIGDVISMDAAKRGCEMILDGSEHAAVYKYLEGRRREMKFLEMSMN
ncbi:MAG: RNA-processing protein [Thermoplasmata archaeon]|nr:RNA-processing protein [Thermoplasmata archaeon]